MSQPSSPPPLRSEERAFDDLVSRTEGLQPWRRVFHAGNGVILALAPPAFGLSPAVTVAGLGLVFLALLAGDILRLRSTRFNRLFFRWFASLASPREAGGIASSTWFALGAALAWALFPARIASASILVLALADPAAGVVGRIWGRRKLGKGSVEGSTVFLVTAGVVLAPFFGWPAALIGAAAGALVEAVPGLVDDNLVVPLATGAALWIVLRSPLPI